MHDKITSNSNPSFISNVVTRSTLITTSKLRFMNKVTLQAKFDVVTIKMLELLYKCILIHYC